MDFLDKKETIKVGPAMKLRILDVLKKDSEFFAANDIIDYSLLVGIHNRSEHPSTFLSRRHSAEFDSDEVASQGYDDKSPLITLNAWDGESMVNLHEENL